MTDNEVISVQEKIRRVMVELNNYGPELEPILPPDLPLKSFLSTINQALRQNPDLLSCTFESLIHACVKAAYDGLRIDGKEAAIVPTNEKGQKIARYMPMVFGLIKQILQSGAAKAVTAVIVYSDEVKAGRFKMLRGTQEGIFHEPSLARPQGSEMVGAYAIATLEPGIVKFEWMDKEAILDVREESKFAAVWDRWPTEMWKKTVIRRLRKSLAGTHVIIDMEAKELFPQFDQATHPQLAAPARPTRQAATLSDRSGEGAGVAMDFGDPREESLARTDVQREAGERDQTQQRAAAQERGGAGGKVAGHSPAAGKKVVETMPVGDEEWAGWVQDLEKKIIAAKTQDEVNVIVAHERERMAAANKGRRDSILAIITERLAELASDAAAGSAQGDDTDNSGPGA